MTEPADLLISAAELSAILRAEADLPPGAPRTRVLDVRWSLAQPDGRPAYRDGHIPGAVYADLEHELSAPGPATRGRHPLPDAASLTAAARRWGLHPGDRVVAYDGGGNFAAARLWWLLRDAGAGEHGHATGGASGAGGGARIESVRLLDGALPAWTAAGLSLETGDVTPAPGTITLGSGRMPRIELDEVAGFARDELLLDVRAAERYEGRDEPIDPRAGHIPGARNLPTAGNLDAAGGFLAPAALRERFASVGIGVDEGAQAGGARIGVSCGSGITASHTLFALALAGIDGELFPGSWSQWANHPELPVAVGPEP